MFYSLILIYFVYIFSIFFFFFFSSRRRHTRYWRDWSSDVCSSDLAGRLRAGRRPSGLRGSPRGLRGGARARRDAKPQEPRRGRARLPRGDGEQDRKSVV